MIETYAKKDTNCSFLVSEVVYNALLEVCPPVPPESGGIIGEKNGVICSYYFDDSPQSLYRATYAPNISGLNHCIQQWAQEGISFCGVFHSHPNNQESLSNPDIEYIAKILNFNSIEKLIFPLVFPACKVIFYQAQLSAKKLILQRVNIQILEEGAK